MKNIIVLFLALYVSFSFGQEYKLLAIKLSSQAFDFDRFCGSDTFGFDYFIRENTFFKVKNDKSLEYKNLSLGKIAKVDLQNPLQIALFYEDFNTVVMLDNQLNEIRKINFSDISVPLTITATGMASQNRLWVYNSLAQQIGFYDYLTNKYTPLTQSLQGNVAYYETDFNYFQWIDDKGTWYACDVFGKIVRQGTVPDFDKIRIPGLQLLLYSKNDAIFLQDFKNNMKYRIENVEKSFKSFSYKEQILSIFTTEGITNYKITIP